MEAGLLALDDPGVPLEEPGALERLAQVRIGLDERAGDPVAHRSGLLVFIEVVLDRTTPDVFRAFQAAVRELADASANLRKLMASGPRLTRQGSISE